MATSADTLQSRDSRSIEQHAAATSNQISTSTLQHGLKTEQPFVDGTRALAMEIESAPVLNTWTRVQQL